MKSVLCDARNEATDYIHCTEECKYFFNQSCKNLISIGYEQGRIDAIKECVKEMEDILGSAYIYENLEYYWKQLKEQKDDNKD